MTKVPYNYLTLLPCQPDTVSEQLAVELDVHGSRECSVITPIISAFVAFAFRKGLLILKIEENHLQLSL